MIRVYLSGNPVHDYVLRAFAEGCGGTLVEGWKYEPAPIAVVFGVRKDRIPQSWARGKIIAHQLRDGGRYIVLETGYVNRGDGPSHHYAAGWDGLNGRADFRNAGANSDRWELLNCELRPWRTDGSVIVLCGQVPWDASVQHSGHVGWCQSMAAKLGRRAGPPFVFRPHPLAPSVNYGIRGCEVSAAPFAEDLERASLVVTYNSNCAVDAVIAGVPAVSMDIGSMAWSVTGHDLDYPRRPDREQWAAELAYTQWTPDEFRRGLAWEHLRK